MNYSTIGCSNPDCKEFHVFVELGTLQYSNRHEWAMTVPISKHYIRPEFSAKPLPEYVPAAIVEDYTEACKIKDLSPKASATLSRRCLQGMIREFCGIKKARLVDEINELRAQVEAGKAAAGVNLESVEAIDSVRTIGNIGAHMEKDISLIIDVEPTEAQALIELIEMLVNEWYVARNTRQSRLARVKAIADQKSQAKNGQLP